MSDTKIHTVQTTKVDKPSTNVVSKKQIFEYVSVASGLPKKDVRAVVEATFEFMAGSLRKGKDVSCAPLGKIKAVEHTNAAGKQMMRYKLSLKDITKP